MFGYGFSDGNIVAKGVPAIRRIYPFHFPELRCHSSKLTKERKEARSYLIHFGWINSQLNEHRLMEY